MGDVGLIGRGLAAMAVCGALVGCGTSAKEDYEHAVKAAEAKIPSGEFVAYAPLDYTPIMRKRAGVLDAFADRLDAIDPPAEVADTHEEWMAALRAYADELRQAAPSGKPPRDTKPQARLQAVRADFESKGYDVTQGAR